MLLSACLKALRRASKRHDSRWWHEAVRLSRDGSEMRASIRLAWQSTPRAARRRIRSSANIVKREIDNSIE